MKLDTEQNPRILFERYGDVVYRRCRQILLDDDAAFDALQEVFLRVLKDRRYRGECSPMTWLYRIATTYCLQQLRNQRRRQKKLDELSGSVSEQVFLPDPEGALTVERILNAQDEVTRQIAYCRVIDGMTLEETAEVVGVSTKTVSRRMRDIGKTVRRMAAASTEERHG